MKSARRSAWPALAAFALAGCASYGPQRLSSGASVQETTAAMGTPSGRYARPGGGERLEYARGPFGKHTFMLDFDAQGHLQSWTQVLTQANFETVRPGEASENVLYALGHPSDTQPIGWQHRMLWSYRYDAPFCIWFQVGVDAQGKVVDTGYGPDPMCERRDHRDK